LFLAAGRGGDADSLGALVGMLYGSYSGMNEEILDLYVPIMSDWDDFLLAERGLELLAKN